MALLSVKCVSIFGLAQSPPIPLTLDFSKAFMA